jgi:hypothetical protein
MPQMLPRALTTIAPGGAEIRGTAILKESK